MRRRICLCLAAFVTALAAACTPQPEPASPAFWTVESPDGGKAWLLGTIHALDKPADWQSPEISAALQQADIVLVEVAGLDDQAHMQAVFNELATSEGLPPLSSRVAPDMRKALEQALDAGGLDDDGFATTETWAAALIVAQSQAEQLDKTYGIDRAVMAAAGDTPVDELEGSRGQLAIFDRLPETEQRDLLEAIISDAQSLDGESATLATAWRTGDMATIERETGRGLLADPELREALFTARNTKWVNQITARIARGRAPFVAVGAAHMIGKDGLPAMLEAQGFTVSRVQ